MISRTITKRHIATLTVALIAISTVYLFMTARLPQHAPLARMYRTEADLMMLSAALDTYRAYHGTYPPAGASGLRLATDFLSTQEDYLPMGPPPDGWARPYIYVPSSAYDSPDSMALEHDGEPYAQGAFQLYSVGADGDAGVEGGEARLDNITHWDQEKSWRTSYRQLQADFDDAQDNAAE